MCPACILGLDVGRGRDCEVTQQGIDIIQEVVTGIRGLSIDKFKVLDFAIKFFDFAIRVVAPLGSPQDI